MVWDFDNTLVDENTDTWLLEQLDRTLYNAVIARWQAQKSHVGEGWLELMDWAFAKLHESGHTQSDFMAALATMPIQDGVLRALQTCEQVNACLRILSDANTVFIRAVLDKNSSIAGAFDRIETNAASFDESGRFRVVSHQGSTAHGCLRCPPNLCKGAVLEQWLNDLGPTRCVYVGDGSNDFCPTTRLRKGDFVLARRPPHGSLLRQCRMQPEAVAATVIEWGGRCDPNAADLTAGMVRALGAD